MKEASFYHSIRPGLTKRGHVCRIENRVGSGMSDVNFAVGGLEFWLELKVAKGQKLYFETSQPIWIKERIKVGIMPLILWLSADETRMHLCLGSALLAADKEYIKKWVVVPCHQMLGWSWDRKPRVNWDDVIEKMVSTKVPKLL